MSRYREDPRDLVAQLRAMQRRLDVLEQRAARRTVEGGGLHVNGAWATSGPGGPTQGSGFVIERAGTYLMCCYGSGYRNFDSGLNWLEAYIDGAFQGGSNFFHNQAGLHMSLNPFVFTIALAKGTHYCWQAHTGTNAATDANDSYGFTWLRVGD